MKIFLIFILLTIAISILAKEIFYSTKRNLFRDQAAWSGKDIKIKYNQEEIKNSKESGNFLKIIADESKVYLEDQNKKENDS